jgi:metallophosphoesterase (TIGR03768 family)
MNHHLRLVALTSLLTLPSGISFATVDADQTLHEEYPIAADVYSTAQREVVPDAITSTTKVYPFQISKYAANGYGVWHYGSGVAVEKRLDLMPTSYTGDSVRGEAGLLRFFTFSDIHITDEESPAQVLYFGFAGGSSSAYSPAMRYGTQVFDAAVQTINAINERKAFDFGISLGDTGNSSDYIETRWYIDVLDGKVITPDSGVRDDPVAGPYNDYQDAFKAAGLDKSIPWYQTLGNHDHFWMGGYPVTDYLRPYYTGTEILNIGNFVTDPLGMNSRGYYMGCIDGRTVDGDVYGYGAVANYQTSPTIPAADADRRPIALREWMAEFFTTDSNPVGHGFTTDNIYNDFASYTFEPKANLPIKVIVLDDTMNASDTANTYGNATVDKKRYDWLVGELEKGQTEGKLMIIALHAPIGVSSVSSDLGWWSGSYVTEAAFIAKLHTYPNLIAILAGHRHQNAITAFKSDDDAHPERGFWQIETSSIKDFPQQFRTIDIVRNSDDTVSIVATNVDPAVRNDSLANLSRTYAVAALQLFKNDIGESTGLPSSGVNNAELVVPLSAEMQTKIRNYGTPLYGAKWSRDWGWVDDTHYPWVYNYTTGNWFYMYSGELNAGVDDGYWIFYYTPDGKDYGWGYVSPNAGWQCYPNGQNARLMDFIDPLPTSN